MEPNLSELITEFVEHWKSSVSTASQEIPSYSEIHHPVKGKISSATNSVEEDRNPLEHSEIRAIRSAREILGDKYLTDCLLLTNLEPCIHCSGAIIQARLAKVVYLVSADTGNGISSLSTEFIYNLNHFPQLIEYKSSQEQEGLVASLKDFFRDKRKSG